MKKNQLKNFILITVLILATGGAMAYSSNKPDGFFSNWISGSPHPHPGNDETLKASGHLVQNKVLLGSDGTVGLSLTLQADDLATGDSPEARNVDMVIVLDRSGSMQGRKLNDARRAVLKLLSNLSAKDRFAMVTYSDGVQIASGLVYVTQDNRVHLATAVNRVRAGGGTNLGAGLQAGINMLRTPYRSNNAARVILISDGLANKGITDSIRLGRMAGVAIEEEFAVSTVGVGHEFNEQLMTAIADRGAGNYYYLENPMAFAEVFQKELFYSKATVATHVSIAFPLSNEISLVDASGYAIEIHNDHAVFYPGDLRSGQIRKLFLTLQVPTGSTGSFEIGKIKARYRFNGQPMETSLDGSYKIACVKSQKEVRASIDKQSWTEKVIREDYNRLKQEVAADIKAGKKQNALKRIHSYYSEQESINATVDSAEVTQNLDRDLKELRQRVEDTFQGAPAAVSRKQKANSKAMQYEGYKGRR